VNAVSPEFPLIDPTLYPATRRYLERVGHLKRGTICYRCSTALRETPQSAAGRSRVQCPGCGASIDRRRSRSGDASAKRNQWVEIAGYMLAGVADVEIGRRLGWPKAAVLCRQALLRIMQETEPELADWWHAHIERGEPVLPAHLHADLANAMHAMAIGQCPQLMRRKQLEDSMPPAQMLEVLAMGLSDREMAERFSVSLNTVQSQWRPVLQDWLAREWPALACWIQACRGQRRRAAGKMAAAVLEAEAQAHQCCPPPPGAEDGAC